jgi:carboxypeptidase T
MPTGLPLLRRLAAVLALATVATAAPPATAAAEADFPAGWEGFHTYAEMSREVAAAAAAHPAIVQRFSIGKSYQGRDLWAAKISDNVAVDESEPEVLFDGLHHAREHMTTEMTLAILRWLTTGYGRDATITKLVNTREIWIIFVVNPDGQLYDISGGKYHLWRKNRQPNAGSTNVGTDLNRNYPYRWGCCNGSSTNTASIMFRGKAPLSAPESRAVANFINSRVVDGRQQIRTAITFHTSGRLVMWPYGYTLNNLPPDMTYTDMKALQAIGRRMAASNGYKPEQASDLYISSGTTRDWEYGRHRIFAYTFELTHGWYPDDSEIASETGRNKRAILYLIEMANCPYRAVGAAAVQLQCGPFADDFEIPRGWRVNPSGIDTATSGGWQRGNPQPTSRSGAKQLGTATSGSSALVTGYAAGTSVWANDLDGVTSALSTPVKIPASGAFKLRLKYYFAHDRASTADDYFRVSIVGSATTKLLEERGRRVDDDAAWVAVAVPIPAAYAGQTVRVLVEAADRGPTGVVEAGVDDLAIIKV